MGLPLRCEIGYWEIHDYLNLHSWQLDYRIIWQSAYDCIRRSYYWNHIAWKSCDLHVRWRIRQRHKSTLSIRLPCGPIQSDQAYTVPSCSLVMHSSVSEFVLIIIGIPLHRESVGGICLSLVDGGADHKCLCRIGVMAWIELLDPLPCSFWPLASVTDSLLSE